MRARARVRLGVNGDQMSVRAPCSAPRPARTKDRRGQSRRVSDDMLPVSFDSYGSIGSNGKGRRRKR
eukprot:1495405-Pleurochrysis_carterae.AAC.1